MIQADGDMEVPEKFFELANQFFTDLLLPSRLNIRAKSQNTTEEYQHLSKVELLLVDFPNSFLKTTSRPASLPKMVYRLFY